MTEEICIVLFQYQHPDELNILGTETIHMRDNMQTNFGVLDRNGDEVIEMEEIQ